ncbi:hypothetical protein QVN42_13060 [Yersinia nurmii]|uniref:DUF3137 domain-containing protein n=1 Tax=Yersinia nurmii TaxID=685706 RepID=A0AAW7K4T4_9GAMM|nr:hypothetical protein [Yersinia nurmii]MDN0088300.1 hypothetical protein [Yersinia nurmii]
MKKKKIADLLAFKTNLFEVLIIAVLVALGVNILSSGLVGYFNFSFLQLIIFGILLILLGALVFLRNAHPINSGKYNFEGVVCLDKNTYDLLEIENYHFTEEVSKYIKALCAENRALHKIWSNEPIGVGFPIEGHNSSKTKANNLLIESIEYYVLKMLALHLSAHFQNNSSISDEHLVKLERKNIPEILLGNRFIDLFSKPMEEREQFLDYGPTPSNGKVVYAFGCNGAIFEHFEMILPRGSSIIRENDLSISIITNRFKFSYRPIFNGFNSNLPRRFESLYMGKDFNSISTFQVELAVSVDFFTKSLLTDEGWEYYWWLDSFLEKLEQSFSKKYFLSKISWNQNAAMFLIAENQRQKQINKTPNDHPEG